MGKIAAGLPPDDENALVLRGGIGVCDEGSGVRTPPAEPVATGGLLSLPLIEGVWLARLTVEDFAGCLGLVGLAVFGGLAGGGGGAAAAGVGRFGRAAACLAAARAAFIC